MRAQSNAYSSKEAADEDIEVFRYLVEIHSIATRKYRCVKLLKSKNMRSKAFEYFNKFASKPEDMNRKEMPSFKKALGNLSPQQRLKVALERAIQDPSNADLKFLEGKITAKMNSLQYHAIFEIAYHRSIDKINTATGNVVIKGRKTLYGESTFAYVEEHIIKLSNMTKESSFFDIGR
jgi:hypothetical protein